MVPTRVDLDLNRQTVDFRHVECAKEILLRSAQPVLHCILRRSIVYGCVERRRVYEDNMLLWRVPQISLRSFSELASYCLYIRRTGSKVCANLDETALRHFFHELRGYSTRS